MKRSILLLLVVAFGIQLGTLPAAAAIPANLSYQGMLTDQDGSTVADGDYEITFRLYTVLEGGSAIWSEVQTVAVLRSVFTATLGTVTPLGALAFDVPYYLGLSVAGGDELVPRQLVTPAAYSFHARSVADGSITAAKIATGAVGTAKIQDGAVTQEKLAEGIEIPLTGTAGGDLTGIYPDPTVRGIRGRSVATTAPSGGQVLKWSGSDWAPQNDGLTLPFSQTHSGTISFQVINTATTGYTYGVYGRSSSTSGSGVYGRASAATGTTYGVLGQSYSTNGRGVYGYANATTGATRGVFGQASSSDANAYGVYYLGGLAGTGGKSFQIDHPLDPANKYLNHYCTEGAEPLNAYSGNVVIDGRGEAVVELPHYFDSINRDYRYQLTPLGAAMPDLHVAEEIMSNRFRIAGGTAGLKVSWRVEAVRNDLYMQQRGAPVELEKPAEHRGTYLHPEFYGLPAEMGTYYHSETPDDPRPDL